MAEHRRIWPFLVYGGLAAIAAARRKETERTPEAGSDGTVRKPYRITYPASHETSEIRGDSQPATRADPDKRPKEHVENDQPISAQTAPSEGAGQGATRRRSMANSLGRVEGYLLARLCERE